MALVHSVKRGWVRYADRLLGEGVVTEEDIECYGREWLLRAARAFDASRGFAFSTSAFYWVRSLIQRRITDLVNSGFRGYRKAALMKSAPKTVRTYKSSDGEARSIFDLIGREDEPHFLREEDSEIASRARKALALMTKTEREVVVESVFGDVSAKEIAERRGVSTWSVMDLVKRGLRRAKNEPRAAALFRRGVWYLLLRDGTLRISTDPKSVRRVSPGKLGVMQKAYVRKLNAKEDSMEAAPVEPAPELSTEKEPKRKEVEREDWKPLRQAVGEILASHGPITVPDLTGKIIERGEVKARCDRSAISSCIYLNAHKEKWVHEGGDTISDRLWRKATETELVKAFQDGLAAAESGSGEEDNPYSEADARHSHFNRGCAGFKYPAALGLPEKPAVSLVRAAPEQERSVAAVEISESDAEFTIRVPIWLMDRVRVEAHILGVPPEEAFRLGCAWRYEDDNFLETLGNAYEDVEKKKAEAKQ